MVTLVPESRDLVDSKVDPTEIDEVVSAFQYPSRPSRTSPPTGLVSAAFASGRVSRSTPPRIRGSIGRSPS